MRQVRVERVRFTQDSDDLTLGIGIDLAVSQPVRFVVPPEAVLGVLAALHDGKEPEVEVHDFDIVDWTTWWEEV